jgi:protein disulfide isomerase
MFFPHDEQTADFQGDLTKVFELETFVKAHRQPLVAKFSGETAVDIFNDGRPIMFLFRNDDDAGEKAEKALREVAPRLKRRLLTSVAGANEPMDQRLMDYIAVAPEELPTVRLVTDPTASMSKYKLEGEITTSSLTNFVADFEGGKLKLFLKSEDVPKVQTGPVYKLVGSTFDAVVTDPSKDVLVEFYAPWCGHCKKLEPVYRDVAKKLEGVSTLVIANMDVTANDVAGLDVEGFPTIKLWRADKKDDPIDYDSDRDVDSFINWLEDKVTFAFSHADIKTEL